MSISAERRGVVAVIVQQGRLLVIRRSAIVAAPGAYCFPGGAMEAGETEQQALRRELREELNVDIQPHKRLWHSQTAWRVALSWWQASLPDVTCIRPNPHEVASVHWFTPDELRVLPDLLDSNLQFLEAWTRGAFELDVFPV